LISETELTLEEYLKSFDDKRVVDTWRTFAYAAQSQKLRVAVSYDSVVKGINAALQLLGHAEKSIGQRAKELMAEKGHKQDTLADALGCSETHT
jgi:hypothetical protein